MADEENPLGGGPFGVGPFGPLVGVAAAAAAAVLVVPVTTGAVFTKTLYYQANIAPPPTAALQAAAEARTPDKWMPRWQGPPKYQTNKGPFAAEPPTAAILANAASAATPDKWLQRWQGPPKYQPNRGPFAAYLPAEPAAIVDSINAATGITTGAVRSKTLFYQASVRPPYAPVEVVVTVTADQWLVPFSGAARRLPPKVTLSTPFVPQLAPPVTADKWLQPFQRKVAAQLPIHTQPVLGTPPVVLCPVTLDSLRTASDITLSGGDLTVTRTTTASGLFYTNSFSTSARDSKRVFKVSLLDAESGNFCGVGVANGSAPLTGSAGSGYLGANTNSIALFFDSTASQVRFGGATVATLGSFVSGDTLLVATDCAAQKIWFKNLSVPGRDWNDTGGADPGTGTGGISYTGIGTSVFAGATIETRIGESYRFNFVPEEAMPTGFSPWCPANTVTPDKWLFRFQAAVPVPPVHHTQPVLGYPYGFVSNLTTSIEWLQKWQGPPRYQPAKILAQPFVPREATLENSIGSMAWMQPFLKAVPHGQPVHTQPFFGYPYVAASNLTTTLEWMVAWQGPPRYQPPKIAAQPFVPREAVLENTQTPDKWLFRFAKAVPTPKPVPTQPVFGYPYESLAIVVPYEQWWHQPLSRAPARPSVHAKPYQPFVPKEAVLENTQTPDKWLQRFAKAAPTPKPVPTQPTLAYAGAPSNLTTTIEWLQKWQGPPRYRPQNKLYHPFVPKAAVVDQVTPDKWLMRWQGPPSYRPIKVQTPPFVPREATAENTVTPDKWLFRFQKAVPGRPVTHTQPFFGYPYADQFITGGPADEPERVVCVLAASRVATEPLLLRDVTVPVALRVAMVPEEARIATPLPSDKIVPSNVFEDIPCPPFGNIAGIPGIGGDVTPEPSEGDHLLLESGDAVLLESGDHILLEGETAAPQEDTLTLEDGDQLLLESGDDILLEET